MIIAEDKLKSFESTVSNYNDEFIDFYKKSEMIEKQNNFIETRHLNQMKLAESIHY